MTIKFSALSVLGLFFCFVASAIEITGAGATFPYPVYSKWAETYKANNGIGLSYQSIGSGAGIKQIEAKAVDFGASDIPLKKEQLQKDSLVQWPMIIGGVVPVVNIIGLKQGELKLTGEVLSEIYLGTIRKWNDSAIIALNRNLKLPDQEIVVAHRSDGSGTTFLFVNYLMKVSKGWAAIAGNNATVAWPVGVGCKGNEGIASFTGRTPSSIGYVEYAFALQHELVCAQMANHDGKFVLAQSSAFQAAAANADWAHAEGFYLVLTDQPGANSWPITGASFILMREVQPDPGRAQTSLSFFSWCFSNGAKIADDLGYVPLPLNVVKMVQSAWTTQIKSQDGKPVYSAR